MKKLIVASVMALGFLGASAQTKIGHINFEELMSAMPELAKIEIELKEYQTSLAEQGQEKNKVADDRAAQFVKDSATFSESKKEIIRGEIIKLYQDAQNWQQQVAQEKYNQKAQEKVIPVRLKAIEAVKLVAKENGYAYIIDESSNALIVSPPGDDILALVKKKLGIKDPVPAVPAKPAAPKTSN